MSRDFDVEAMIAAAKRGTTEDVPILGQQAPVLRGIPVNGGLLTINELEGMSERAFRELFLGVIVNLLGGVYAPAPPPASAVEEPVEQQEVEESDPED